MKYLRLFETTAAYDAAKDNLDLPNVSYIDETQVVEYNPWVETRVVATVNVTSTSDPTYILNDTAYFSAVEIDGVEQPSFEYEYTFSTTGEHTVKYTLIDPTSIGGYAFSSTGLTSITIPNSVTSIGEEAFSGCSSLTSITIPDSVTSIGNNAFDSCDSLTSITIPDSVTSIGDWAFGSCSGFTNITIPDSVTSIGEGAFGGCSGLTSIVVDSANTVYDSRDNCNAIINTSTNELILGCKNTVIPNTVTSIGDWAFNMCTSLTSITIPNSVTSIGYGAFWVCSGLTNITIPNSVTSIGEGAFNGCSGLTSITIPDSVTSIGDSTFNGCRGLTSVTISSGVTSIGNNAFQYCTCLTSITSNATTAPTIQSTTFNNVNTGGTLTVPSGSTGYDVWMGTGNYYLGKYNWSKVEQ